MPYIEFFEVDEEGNIIEKYLLNTDVEEVPPNYVEGWGPSGLYKPKYDWGKGEWYESDPEGSLNITREALYGNYLSEREGILKDGFEHKGDYYAYDSEGQQQFMMAMFNLSLRPSLTSVTIFTKEGSYKEFAKEEFLVMYDKGEQLKKNLQDDYTAMKSYLEGLHSIEELDNMPRRFKEARELLTLS
jgi:hypothetical protein